MPKENTSACVEQQQHVDMPFIFQNQLLVAAVKFMLVSEDLVVAAQMSACVGCTTFFCQAAGIPFNVAFNQSAINNRQQSVTELSRHWLAVLKSVSTRAAYLFIVRPS